VPCGAGDGLPAAALARLAAAFAATNVHLVLWHEALAIVRMLAGSTGRGIRSVVT